jgi:hypothetical protein
VNWLPHCARCGASAADRMYFAFTESDGEPAEAYCSECLSPEELEMILGLAARQPGTL